VCVFCYFGIILFSSTDITRRPMSDLVCLIVSKYCVWQIIFCRRSVRESNCVSTRLPATLLFFVLYTKCLLGEVKSVPEVSPRLKSKLNAEGFGVLLTKTLEEMTKSFFFFSYACHLP